MGLGQTAMYIHFRLKRASPRALKRSHVSRARKMEKWEARVLSAVLSALVILNGVKARALSEGKNPACRRRSKNRRAAGE